MLNNVYASIRTYYFIYHNVSGILDIFLIRHKREILSATGKNNKGDAQDEP